MRKKKFQRKKKIMYTEDNSASGEEENDNSPWDFLFMAMIQDGNVTGGK